MKLSESIVESKRIRLPDRDDRIAKNSGPARMVGFLFGIPFMAAGTAIILIGLKIIPYDPSSIHAPYWVLTLAGGMFIGAGAILWAIVLKEHIRILKWRRFAGENPGSKVYADYPWDFRGITKSPWGPALKSFWGTLFLGIFMTPFNWWAWASGAGGLMVMAIVSLFDLFLLFACIELVRRLLVALKYGSSRLAYQRFPYFTGETVQLRWVPPSGLTFATGIEFILRCIEEWTESAESVENQRPRRVHEQIWAATHSAEGQIYCQHNRPITLSFDVPVATPGSRLSEEKMRTTFWELNVCVQAPGVDFSERYLVPIYTPET
jgi:hypothetical protein